MTAARLVARTVRGLEQMVADEVRLLGAVEWVGYREVGFRCAEPTSAVLGLRCADDVLVHGASVRGVGAARADLGRLTAAVLAMPVAESLAVRKRCGGADTVAGVEVSASFVGRRNFSRYDIEDAVGGPLAARLGVPYWSRRGGVAPPGGGLGWRVTLEGERALVGLRIGERPLHRREYRRVTRAGSVHPPVAAAMARLGGVGGRMLDPCCGAGTLAVEAALAGAELVLGFDRDAEAVAAARANWGGVTGADMVGGAGDARPGAGVGWEPASSGQAGAVDWEAAGSEQAGTGVAWSVTDAGRARAGTASSVADDGRAEAEVARNVPNAGQVGARVAWAVADAGRIPVADGAIDLVLCNPPWDRQVPAAGILARRPDRFWRELRRVLRPGGRAVLLLPEHGIRPAGFRVLSRVPISLAGRQPEIVTLAAPGPTDR
ncbi:MULTISPECIES: methyltransferase domain-containing protein [unclassified Crossiella]|uniref:methyltransferase domain-containing protein n=1 Tax=unclassified Crossiella TaxID=2620835 RepID=UPI001FFFD1E6|nr:MULTISPECIES: methyltransferase domain-containing protein [unclassified Crossiella]MCK2241608.1 methyltransferase domain-containing protein [Crossiella sp. S99.2]MCK2255520.1 methyltransferase domain-containing protein [Crossiella sp. S99.1]